MTDEKPISPGRIRSVLSHPRLIDALASALRRAIKADPAVKDRWQKSIDEKEAWLERERARRITP